MTVEELIQQLKDYMQDAGPEAKVYWQEDDIEVDSVENAPWGILLGG